MSQLMVQISLMRVCDDKRIAAFTTWVPVDKRLKVGVLVTLKGLNGEWTVTHIYDDPHEMDEVSNYGWDNNDYTKHTGLNV